MATVTRTRPAAPACRLEELEQRTLMSVVTDPAAGALQMRLTIDLTAGTATVTNTTGQELHVDGYQLFSRGGHLNPTGWRSIADSRAANYDQVVSTLGEDAVQFSELTCTGSTLSEANLSGYAAFRPGLAWSIGNPLVGGTASADDLRWYYITSDSGTGDMLLGELVILQPPPEPATVGVDALTTADNTPGLTGTVSDPTAAVTVTVNGHTYTSAVNHGDGTWTMADGAIETALADGTYNVTVSASLDGEVIATDATDDELVISGGTAWVGITPTRNASEAAGTTTGKGVFTVTRIGGDFSRDLVVYYGIGGTSTATAGDDYAELMGHVTIPAGEASATIDVLAVSDNLVEPSESLTLSLSADPAYGLVPEASEATVTIADNSATVSIVCTQQASENNGTTTGKGIFTVTRAGGDLTRPLVVYYSIGAGSTAAEGSDFSPLTGCVTIAAGESSATIDILALDDTAAEPAETVVLALSANPGYTLDPARATAILQIYDSGPTVSIAKIRDGRETSGLTAGRGQFSVTRAGRSLSQPLVVYYTVGAASTATEGADYIALPGMVTIPAGKSSATFYAQIIDDSLAEPAETLTLDLAEPIAYKIAPTKASATISITDNEPTLSVVKTLNTSEAATATTGKGSFSVTRVGGSVLEPLVVCYSVDSASTATAGEDYVPLTGSVTIPAGRRSAAISVQAVADGLIEGTETLTVTLSSWAGYRIAPAKASAIMSIFDRTPVPPDRLSSPTPTDDIWTPLALCSWTAPPVPAFVDA